MHRLLIIEDEPYIRKAIKTLILELRDDIVIVGECDSVEDALVVTKATKPNIVLLDINLKDGTGFDFLEQLHHQDFNLIFITSYKEHAIKAIKSGAIDYILKPLDEKELNIALTKATQKTPNFNNKNSELVKQQLSGSIKRIVLSLQEGYQIIDLNDLIYCKSDGGYTTFYLINDKTHIASKSLIEFENMLPKDRFIRTHQSYIVNKDYASRLDKKRYLLLKNSKSVPVSMRKLNTVIAELFK